MYTVSNREKTYKIFVNLQISIYNLHYIYIVLEPEELWGYKPGDLS